MCGAKITSADDKLIKVPISYVADKLRNPNPDLASNIRQMRDMRAIDEKRYKEFKKQLPYIVTGWFAPPIRRTENFAYIESFIVDLDHLQEKEFGIVSLKNLVNRDSRVMLTFVSPSNDGLKILFRLKERCTDAGIFKLFYKEFVKKFSTQYNLMQVTDSATCDVTRACFMSIDSEVFYNPEAETIDIKDYLDLNNPCELFDTKHNQDEGEKKQPKTEIEKIKDPDEEALTKIKELLTGKQPQTKKKPNNIVVPEILNEIIDGLIQYIKDNGAEVYETINIQSAKKLKIKLGLKKAEINLFYGKKGFTVTSVPKGETDGEFNEVMKQLIQLYILENKKTDVTQETRNN